MAELLNELLLRRLGGSIAVPFTAPAPRTSEGWLGRSLAVPDGRLPRVAPTPDASRSQQLFTDSPGDGCLRAQLSRCAGDADLGGMAYCGGAAKLRSPEGIAEGRFGRASGSGAPLVSGGAIRCGQAR